MTPDERGSASAEAAAEKSLAVRRVADAAAQARVRRRLVVAGVGLLVAVAVGAVVIGGKALVTSLRGLDEHLGSYDGQARDPAADDEGGHAPRMRGANAQKDEP